ncbi:hypothetical protein [Ascidiimonas sp. W6]|uniref:hypothetical protein n=1 Tax=Ascidiimonas meishanensis TaxID=3128903 RepID=UPI0030EE3488
MLSGLSMLRLGGGGEMPEIIMVVNNHKKDVSKTISNVIDLAINYYKSINDTCSRCIHIQDL